MKYTQLSDSELIHLYRSGHAKAFSVLLKRHQSKLFASICFIVKNRCEAEDILQDVLAKAVTLIQNGSYHDEGKFSAWINCLAHNQAIDSYRRLKRTPFIHLADPSGMFEVFPITQSNYEQAQTSKDIKLQIRDLIWHLPKEQKQVLIMRHYLNMSFQEIADRMDVSINTALGRMRYALIHLRKEWTKLNAQPERNMALPV